MRRRLSVSPTFFALLGLHGVGALAVPHDEFCEKVGRESQGSGRSSSLLQHERSRIWLGSTSEHEGSREASSPTLHMDTKHPDLTDGVTPWKPDTGKPPSMNSTTVPPTTTMAPTSSSAAPTTTTLPTSSSAATLPLTNTTLPTSSSAATLPLTTTMVPTSSSAATTSRAATASSTASTSNASWTTATSTIVINMSNISSVGNETGGCCFTYGFGSAMVPCCLRASMVANRSYCSEAKNDVIGSKTAFVYGKCPTSAAEAAELAAKAPKANLSERCTPGNACGEGVLPKDRGICIKPEGGGSTECWDICDSSHAPQEYTLGDGDPDFAMKLAQAVQDVRDGKTAELSCLGAEQGVVINGTLPGDMSFEEKLAAAATAASQADGLAEEATIQAEQLLAMARNTFAKAMNDGATPDNLLAAAKTWEDVAEAHSRAYTAASSVAESIKALSKLLAKGSKTAAKEMATKREEAEKKEAIARKRKEIAAKKRLEAEEAKALAMKALAEAQRARAEVNASIAGYVNITVGDINGTLTWNASWNASRNASKAVVQAAEQ